MISVSAAEFQRQFGRYREAALREPVAVTSYGRESVVLLSAEEYRRLKQHDRVAQYAWETPPDELEQIARADAPADSAKHDHELE